MRHRTSRYIFFFICPAPFVEQRVPYFFFRIHSLQNIQCSFSLYRIMIECSSLTFFSFSRLLTSVYFFCVCLPFIFHFSYHHHHSCHVWECDGMWIWYYSTTIYIYIYSMLLCVNDGTHRTRKFNNENILSAANSVQQRQAILLCAIHVLHSEEEKKKNYM